MNSARSDRLQRPAVTGMAVYSTRWSMALLFGLLLLASGAAVADGAGESYQSVARELGAAARFEMPKTLRRREASGELYAWGVTEAAADDFTRMTGWRLSESWHFGYQQGLDSGLSLLWQGERDQMSVSTDGIRFTRRF